MNNIHWIIAGTALGCVCFTYASLILSLFSGYSLLSCASFGTWTRGESQHRYTSSRNFVHRRIRWFMKSLIHDFGSSIFSSHCHTCILACCCHLCYSNPSILKSDDRTILSQEGRIKAIHWALSCSVSPSIRICCACNLSLWLASWMIWRWAAHRM